MKHISTVVCLTILSLMLCLSGCNKRTSEDDARAAPVLGNAVITGVACGTETPVRCVTSVLLLDGANTGRVCSIDEMLGTRGDTVKVNSFTYDITHSLGCDNN